MDHENLQSERYKIYKDFRFPIEVGMKPENSQLKRYKVCKDFRFPTEEESSSQKILDGKYNSIRELFSLNCGKFPLRSLFPHKLRALSFGR